MGVYFRTGENSGVGVSWWFYLLVVLPFQLLAVTIKAGAWLIIFLALGTAKTSRTLWGQWQRWRRESP